MSQPQRLALGLCAVLVCLLVEPFLDDVAHGRSAWLADMPFLLLGVSVAVGMAAAIRDPTGVERTTLDVVRHRTFWVGVVLLPVAWLVAALLV
jgi:hypothetical protein